MRGAIVFTNHGYKRLSAFIALACAVSIRSEPKPKRNTVNTHRNVVRMRADVATSYAYRAFTQKVRVRVRVRVLFLLPQAHAQAMQAKKAQAVL